MPAWCRRGGWCCSRALPSLSQCWPSTCWATASATCWIPGSGDRFSCPDRVVAAILSSNSFMFLSPLGERLGEGVVARDDYDTDKARDLRRDGSRAERKVWELLRARRIGGAKFRRQHPIGPYFADFACLSRKLVIEVDGDHHAFQIEADARRTATMEREGWRILRFWANEVVQNPEGIWSAIEIALNSASPPLPTSPPNGGEEEE